MVNATVVKTKIYLRICLQIYSLFFTAAAGALLKEVTGQAWLQAMVSGIAAIQRYTYLYGCEVLLATQKHLGKLI